MNRRTFISTSIAATLAASSKPSWAADTAHHIDRVGVQLYTVRDAMKTDFEGALAKVAAIGYKEVEFAGYFDSCSERHPRRPRQEWLGLAFVPRWLRRRRKSGPRLWRPPKS